MNEMIERVAMALARHNGCVITQKFVGKSGGLTETVEIWRDWIPFARETIKAMREPTLQMQEAGADCGTVNLCWAEMLHRYRVMIDKALE